MSDSIPMIEPFYHADTGSYAYLVYDAATRAAVVIDAVLDFDRRSGVIATIAADAMLARIAELELTVRWILETHAHADHLSACDYLKRRLDAPLATGANIVTVQRSAARLFALDASVPLDGSQYDRLLPDGEVLAVGGLSCRVLATPGHTPDSVCYLIGDALFVGDTLFQPDVGSARCDFPGASARQSYASVRRLFELPDATRVMVGHDYPPESRDPMHETDIGLERRANLHLKAEKTLEQFV